MGELIAWEIMVMMMCYGVICYIIVCLWRGWKLFLEHDSSRATINVAWLGDITMYTARFISSKRSHSKSADERSFIPRHHAMLYYAATPCYI